MSDARDGTFQGSVYIHLHSRVHWGHTWFFFSDLTKTLNQHYDPHQGKPLTEDERAAHVKSLYILGRKDSNAQLLLHRQDTCMTWNVCTATRLLTRRSYGENDLNCKSATLKWMIFKINGGEGTWISSAHLLFVLLVDVGAFTQQQLGDLLPLWVGRGNCTMLQQQH